MNKKILKTAAGIAAALIAAAICTAIYRARR